MKNVGRLIHKGVMAAVGTTALAAATFPSFVIAAGGGAAGGGGAGAGAAAAGGAGAGAAGTGAAANGSAAPGTAAPGTAATGGKKGALTTAVRPFPGNAPLPGAATTINGNGGMPVTGVGTPASATANIGTAQGAIGTQGQLPTNSATGALNPAAMPNTNSLYGTSSAQRLIGNAPSPLGNMQYGAQGTPGVGMGAYNNSAYGPYAYGNAAGVGGGAGATGYQNGQWQGGQTNGSNQGAASWNGGYPGSAYTGSYSPNYYGANNYTSNFAPSYGYNQSQYGQLPNGPQNFANGNNVAGGNVNSNGSTAQGRVQYGWW
jgi:hypothetical protein